MQMFWPILLVLTANTFYNIVAKQTPDDVDPFLTLVVTYGVAMVISFVLFLITADSRDIVSQFGKLNWTSFMFGVIIIALEFGYINIYRVGWKISTASLAANIGLAVVLLIVGVLVYKEALTAKQLAGMAACLLGLILISK